MVNRQTQLSSGGTVLVRESVLRGSGPPGPRGPQGAQGAAIHIVGVKANEALIKAVGGTAEAKHAYGWIADDTGILWVWYRDYPDSVSNLAGSWSNAGVMRGNPGYLNSVAALAEASSKTGTVYQTVVSNTPTIMLWNLTHVDTEVVPTEVVGGQVLSNQPRPIVVGWRVGDGSNAQALTDIDRVAPNVPPQETALSYPFGSSVFLVNILLYFDPALAVREGTLDVRLYWTPDGVNRTLVANNVNLISSVRSSVSLSTFVRGIVGGQYEVEVVSSVAGQIRERRWEWIRAGGGPGPKGDTGETGEPVRIHPASPLALHTDLPSVTGNFPGEMIYTANTGELYMWQMAADNSGYLWVKIGVVRGTAGTANDGFAEFDDLVGTNMLPGDNTGQQKDAPLVTTDQGLPYPAPTFQPRVPFFIKALADKVEKMLVGRFSTAAARATKRTSPQAGEVSWVDGAASHERGLDVYIGGTQTAKYARIPVVIVSATDDAPAGQSNYPDGTLWIRHG